MVSDRSLRRALCILVLAVSLTFSCTTFQGLKPEYPGVGRPTRYKTVDSLEPVLRWKPAVEPGTTYDLVIYRAEDTRKRAMKGGKPGEKVYYREGLAEASHRVAPPLAPRMKYLWSVRTRQGDEVSAWSTYTYMYGGRIGDAYRDDNQLFRFQTPGR